MARIRSLRNPPITEALIDIRAVLPRGFFEPGVLKRVRDELIRDYPAIEQRFLFEIQVPRRAPDQTSSTETTHGYFFKSADGRTIAQFRIDGFTFNRLSPYPGWETLFPEALRIWDMYATALSPSSVTRIAVRYINHLALPLLTGGLSDYLAAPPAIPGELPGSLKGFLSRLDIYDPSHQLSAHITQSSEEVPGSNVTVILDIDAYRTGTFGVSREELVPVLESLRTFKNAIFFGSITERTVGMYE